MSERKPKKSKATDCGHGRVLNPCAIRLEAFIGCQACARMVMVGGGGIIMAAIPNEAIPLPGETITLHRAELGEGAFTFVYRAPSNVGRAGAEGADRSPQDASGPTAAPAPEPRPQGGPTSA